MYLHTTVTRFAPHFICAHQVSGHAPHSVRPSPKLVLTKCPRNTKHFPSSARVLPDGIHSQDIVKCLIHRVWNKDLVS